MVLNWRSEAGCIWACFRALELLIFRLLKDVSTKHVEYCCVAPPIFTTVLEASRPLERHEEYPARWLRTMYYRKVQRRSIIDHQELANGSP